MHDRQADASVLPVDGLYVPGAHTWHIIAIILLPPVQSKMSTPEPVRMTNLISESLYQVLYSVDVTALSVDRHWHLAVPPDTVMVVEPPSICAETHSLPPASMSPIAAKRMLTVWVVE